MNDILQKVQELRERFEKSFALVDTAEKKQELEALRAAMNKPGFWDDQAKASKISAEASELEKEFTDWRELGKRLEDLREIVELDKNDQSVNLREDAEKEIVKLEKRLRELETALLFQDKYDKYDAVLAIHAGAGGTDAQDWAEMLLRMLMRFAEQRGWKTQIINLSAGQEAGLKSVLFEIKGRNAYGWLKSEAGVHRLVRISPFDAEKMRHTSFALVEILPLIDESDKVDIKSDDLRVDTFRAGGHGGQGVNTTDSAVRITHLPTGITVSCQNERSQIQNKQKAMSILIAKLQKYYESEQEEEKQRLRGEFTEAAWGNQARSYVLHPYKMVKDHRTGVETNEVDKVLDGDLTEFVEAYLRS